MKQIDYFNSNDVFYFAVLVNPMYVRTLEKRGFIQRNYIVHVKSMEFYLGASLQRNRCVTTNFKEFAALTFI